MTATMPDSADARPPLHLPTAVGLIGTCVVCFAAMLGNTSEIKLQSFAFILWIVGLLTQAGALALAYAYRRARRARVPADDLASG
ncbi:MAG: hypothetical protein ACRECC_01305 [Pseudolabrys sp.]